MCFMCGAPCIGERTECGFVFEFCDACLVENDLQVLRSVMESKHAAECGCPDDSEFLGVKAASDASRLVAPLN